jgi:hypothetical protein
MLVVSQSVNIPTEMVVMMMMMITLALRGDKYSYVNYTTEMISGSVVLFWRKATKLFRINVQIWFTL